MHLFIAGILVRPPLLHSYFLALWCVPTIQVHYNHSEELQSILISLYTQGGVLILILQGMQNSITEIEAQIIMSHIKIEMEVDSTNPFNHLSLTALFSDLLGLFRKRSYGSLYLLPGRWKARQTLGTAWFNTVLNQVIRTWAVHHIWWWILCRLDQGVQILAQTLLGCSCEGVFGQD